MDRFLDDFGLEHYTLAVFVLGIECGESFASELVQFSGTLSVQGGKEDIDPKRSWSDWKGCLSCSTIASKGG